MYDFMIVIPKGRKNGKYLRSIWGRRVEDKKISDLTRSLIYTVCNITGSEKEIKRTLEACHSCMSTREEGYECWGKIPGVHILGMKDEHGQYVARALINVMRGTYAPAYGPMHWALEARLEFAGYEKGPIAELDQISGALSEVVHPDSMTTPKSRRVVKHHTISAYLHSEEEIKEARDGFQAVFGHLRVSRPQEFVARKRSDRYYKMLLHNRRVRRLLRKGYTPDSDGKIRWKTHHFIPIAEEWDYIDRPMHYSGREAFVDETREFVSGEQTILPGWYKK